MYISRFQEMPQDFEEAIRNRYMHRASPAAIALLKSLKPYPGGNDPLRDLHDLDIMDKHQALLPTLDMIGMPDFLGGKEIVRGVHVGPIRDGTIVPADPQITPYIRVGGSYQGTFSMRFPIGGPLAGQEIVPALIVLAKAVEDIVESFADLYR